MTVFLAVGLSLLVAVLLSYWVAPKTKVVEFVALGTSWFFLGITLLMWLMMAID